MNFSSLLFWRKKPQAVAVSPAPPAIPIHPPLNRRHTAHRQRNFTATVNQGELERRFEREAEQRVVEQVRERRRREEDDASWRRQQDDTNAVLAGMMLSNLHTSHSPAPAPAPATCEAPARESYTGSWSSNDTSDSSSDSSPSCSSDD